MPRNREALNAQREVAAPRQDAARLTAYAQALWSTWTRTPSRDLRPERAVATRIALEAIQGRSAQLLVRLADATSGRGEERRRAGRQGTDGTSRAA